MTQQEAFEANLARGGDNCVVRSKLLFAVATTTTPSVALAITPSALGGRQATIGAVFSDFRVKQIVVKFLAPDTGSSVSFTVVMGFLDDASGAEGDAPTTAAGVLELRCSGSSLASSTVPTQFTYKPTDTKKWFKTYPGSSGSDQRLVVPAELYIAQLSATSAPVAVELDIEIVYKGAVDVATL